MKNANPVSGGRRCALLLLLALAGCAEGAPGRAPSIPPLATNADAPVQHYTYEVVASWQLEGVIPVRWSGPQLSPDSPKVATETLELAHHGFLNTEAGG